VLTARPQPPSRSVSPTAPHRPPLLPYQPDTSRPFSCGRLLRAPCAPRGLPRTVRRAPRGAGAHARRAGGRHTPLCVAALLPRLAVELDREAAAAPSKGAGVGACGGAALAALLAEAAGMRGMEALAEALAPAAQGAPRGGAPLLAAVRAPLLALLYPPQPRGAPARRAQPGGAPPAEEAAELLAEMLLRGGPELAPYALRTLRVRDPSHLPVPGPARRHGTRAPLPATARSGGGRYPPTTTLVLSGHAASLAPY
jgi:hypothetical protein